MIRMNAFAREPDDLLREELGAVEAVLRSGWWILGEQVAAFEQEWGNACGARHAVGVGNGLDALEIEKLPKRVRNLERLARTA